MNLAVWTIALWASAYAQSTNRGQSCITPNNEHATCIAARSCKLIFEPLGTRDPMAIDFAKRSLCGYDTEPLFCCGSLAYFDPERINGTGSVSNQMDINKVLPDRTSCGFNGLPSIILGDETTRFGEFRWLAVLEYKNKSTGVSLGIKCGGSLITERYILTAAHCLGGGDVEVSRAWLGDYDITSDPDCRQRLAHRQCSEPVQKINIARIIPHTGFIEATGKDDIGLLRLEKAIKFTEYIRPICLPTENLPDPSLGSFLTVAGWGIDDDGKLSDVKLTGHVPLLSKAACNAKLLARLTADQYCAGDEDGKDSCKGDSGGPLMREYQINFTPEVQWYQEGIVSHDFGCRRYGYPVRYTRVSNYVNWIVNAIIQDNSRKRIRNFF